ncbi:T cell activation RhoGTPase activating protein b isoform X1 [Lepisosteus oculatus]|uniref:T cell activation RhoGTPase activating protein b isoform X1 n=1 Tax=Lepisosteus oculatus TaxID=7918 RepID=UPI0035F500C9
MRRGSYDDVATPISPLRSLAQRRRSAPALVLGRVLSKSWSPVRENVLCPVSVEQCPFVLGLAGENGELILDECVQVSEGTKTKMRHLFLFSDVLVIAKLKSNTSYRLKHRVHLSELWLASSEEKTDAVVFNPRTAFLIAWPSNFCVISFSCPEVKERWLDTLHWKIKEAKDNEVLRVPTTNILMKVLSGSTAFKTLSGGNMDSLIESGLDGDAKTCHSPTPCDMEDGTCQTIAENNKKRKKVLNWPFQRRSSTLSNSSNRSDPDQNIPVFGRQLSDICAEDEKPPKPIMDILTLLLQKGTTTEGIFRKAGNAKACKEIKEQLNAGTEINLEPKPIILLAAVLKDFLRHIPNGLLRTELSPSWMTAVEKNIVEEKHEELKLVAAKLPGPNIVLLQHLLCVLYHISKNAEINRMDAKNLAVCIAPNMLLDSKLPLQAQKEMTEKVTTLTQFMIENCCEIFGEHILSLLGDPEEELADNSDTLSSHQHDSAYDSTDADGDLGDHARKQLSERGEEDDQEQTSASPLSSVCEDERTAIGTCPTQLKRFNRRCSEPNILPSGGLKTHKLARSHDDFSVERDDLSFEDQPLKKQNSDDSFLMHHSGDRRPLSCLKLSSSLTMELCKTPSSKGSSTCSLESSFSTVSENSVFTSSPLASPSIPKKSFFSRHQSFSAKAAEDSEKPEKDLKKHSQSFCVRNEKKPLFKAKSWGPSNFNRSSLKRDSQKENQFSCDTLQEDSQNEAEPADPQPQSRTLSPSAVFRHVDSRKPSNPPSYEQAIQSGTTPAPPEYKSLTVQDARRKMSINRRPSSLTEDLLYPCSINRFSDCYAQEKDSENHGPVVTEHTSTFRQRAMSESISRTRLERVSRRCSQPLFEEISYAKESYV